MAGHPVKSRDILARLDAANDITDMDLPGFRLHSLKGQFESFWTDLQASDAKVISCDTRELITSAEMCVIGPSGKQTEQLEGSARLMMTKNFECSVTRSQTAAARSSQ